MKIKFWWWQEAFQIFRLSFHHSGLIPGFVAIVTRRVPHVEQELLTLRTSLSVLLSFFLLAIVLSVLLRFADSDYNIGILRHFLLIFDSHSNFQTSNLYPIYLQMSHPTQFWNGLKKLSYILTYNKYKVLSEYIVGLVIFMVFIATFNNISALSWRSVLLMKETGIPGENHRPVASHGQTLNIWVDSCYCYLYIYLHNQLFYRQFRCM